MGQLAVVKTGLGQIPEAESEYSINKRVFLFSFFKRSNSFLKCDHVFVAEFSSRLLI
jgi:hypothetical protein